VKFSSTKPPYLKYSSMPMLTNTESSIQAWRERSLFALTRPCAAYQSTTVETQSRITNGGFHAE
jgi:hypothetical protein